jgi:hypothetical protein
MSIGMSIDVIVDWRILPNPNPQSQSPIRNQQNPHSAIRNPQFAPAQ